VPQRTADPNGVIEFQSKNPDLYEIYDKLQLREQQQQHERRAHAGQLPPAPPQPADDAELRLGDVHRAMEHAHVAADGGDRQCPTPALT
jgi:hypothetical protein